MIRHRIDDRIRSVWQQANALDVMVQARAARRWVREFCPDIVHAFRMQNEGYVAARVGFHPWVLSTWGQDLAYYAQRYRVHDWLCRRALPQVDAVTADCYRDLRLAREYGAPEGIPYRFFPGNAGVDLDAYAAGLPAAERPLHILYPRGFAPYLRPETVFAAASQLPAIFPEKQLKLICLSPPAQTQLYHQAFARHRMPAEFAEVRSFSSQSAWAELLQSVAVIISPAVCDGTPNSVLEGMACGAFPVVGDIESLREWMEHGRNGLLFDPEDPESLRDCLQRAIEDLPLRESAQVANRQLIACRADARKTVPEIVAFYGDLAQRARRAGDA